MKTVIVKSDNAAKNLPTVQASYLLIRNDTGETVAIMDGTELTRRRTAAASALAADYLARPDASTLVLVGAGALGAHFVRAHAAVRPIKRVFIYNRSPEKAAALAAELKTDGLDASAVTDLRSAVASGRYRILCHDLHNAHRQGRMAETRCPCRPRWSLQAQPCAKPTATWWPAPGFMSTREKGHLSEAGDLLQARDEGKFDFANVQGDLFDLCRGTVKGRGNPQEITLFKSCGTALEDLATAIMVYLRS